MYLKSSWRSDFENILMPPLVAYFSMEYGLHEEFHSYAGGLGILAGDFIKSARHLGLSVGGIGPRWAQGHTAQRDRADRDPYRRLPRQPSRTPTPPGGRCASVSSSPPPRQCPRETRSTRSRTSGGWARVASSWALSCGRSAATRST